MLERILGARWVDLFNPNHDQLGRFAAAPERGAGARGGRTAARPGEAEFLAGGGPAQQYHVTTLDRVESILEKGLLPAYAAAPGQAWEASHSREATYYHGSAEPARRDRRDMDALGAGAVGAIIVFRIPRTRAAARSILPDEDSGTAEADALTDFLQGASGAVRGGVPRKWITGVILPHDTPLAVAKRIAAHDVGVSFDSRRDKWR